MSAAGLRIGFTNGRFDLLHPGHVSLLNQARGACDQVIGACLVKRQGGKIVLADLTPGYSTTDTIEKLSS